MKLELFDFIEQTLDIIDSKSEELNKVAGELEKFFNDSLFIKDHFLNVNYRIKSSESLKEKILRHNFYMKYDTPEDLVEDLSDLIGFRIECRFIEDESKIYQDILRLFNNQQEDGYYSNVLNESISLNLDEKQPQIQKNGFEIYKIDGRYRKDGVTVNFELQIKSMVNVFWGDIDHRVLYKNFNYMLTEDFFRDIMSSIKDNLTMIDRQLMLIYNHLSSMDASSTPSKNTQIKNLISKTIHDIYIVKVRQEVGFVLDFKKSSDVIVDFIFSRTENDNGNYGESFLRIINRLNEIGSKNMDFNDFIDFDREFVYNDDFSKKIGSSILQVINKDFRWNLFFKIIFDIEEGTKTQDFEGFIHYLRSGYLEIISHSMDGMRLSHDEKTEMEVQLLEYIYESFEKEASIDFINLVAVQNLENYLLNLIGPINDYDGWLASRKDIKTKILEFQIQ
ncbi:MAG: (p)ppGpp synthetase [Gudongella sp.]|jgi:ppGpp synthetase/RelA/SpoT-type nucleotidyltranferase|nr:(p)ppGpp synthetase [Gudongella sp.]